MEYNPGDLLWWSDKWVCSGYYPPIRAMFVKYRNTAKKNCGIAVQMRDGSWIAKWVSVEYIEKR